MIARMTNGARLPMVYVTGALLDETARILASFAATRDSEGVVYWFGIEVGNCAAVTTLVVPDADMTFGCVSTSPAVNAEALTVAVGTPLVLLGQAHSHPSSMVGHSTTDDRDTFAQFPGAISVVVPHFGRRGMQLDECGVHRQLNGRYRRLRGDAIRRHLRVLPSLADFRSAHAHL